jgi:hypothetical protein
MKDQPTFFIPLNGKSLFGCPDPNLFQRKYGKKTHSHVVRSSLVAVPDWGAFPFWIYILADNTTRPRDPSALFYFHHSYFDNIDPLLVNCSQSPNQHSIVDIFTESSPRCRVKQSSRHILDVGPRPS